MESDSDRDAPASNAVANYYPRYSIESSTVICLLTSSRLTNLLYYMNYSPSMAMIHAEHPFHSSANTISHCYAEFDDHFGAYGLGLYSTWESYACVLSDVSLKYLSTSGVKLFFLPNLNTIDPSDFRRAKGR